MITLGTVYFSPPVTFLVLSRLRQQDLIPFIIRRKLKLLLPLPPTPVLPPPPNNALATDTFVFVESQH